MREQNREETSWFEGGFRVSFVPRAGPPAFGDTMTPSMAPKRSPRLPVAHRKPSTWREVSETRTAFHEAGHAVVAVALGVPIKRLALFRRGPGDLGSLARSFTISRPPLTCSEVNAIVALSGIEAEKIRFGDFYRDGSEVDLYSATEEIERACGHCSPTLRRKYRRHAQRILRLRWPAVELLAATLERKRRMTGREVLETVSRAPPASEHQGRSSPKRGD